MSVRMEFTFGFWTVTGSGVVGTGGGIYEAFSGFQAPKRSRSLEIASRWLWCDIDGASLMSHESNWRAWTIQYSGVSVGWLT